MLVLIHPRDQSEIIQCRKLCRCCIQKVHNQFFLHINSSGLSDRDNLQPSLNYEPKSEPVIRLLSVGIILHTKALWWENLFKDLDKLKLNVNSSCHDFLMGAGKVFVSNCYNILQLITMLYKFSVIFYSFFCVQLKVPWEIVKRKS